MSKSSSSKSDIVTPETYGLNSVGTGITRISLASVAFYAAYCKPDLSSHEMAQISIFIDAAEDRLRGTTLWTQLLNTLRKAQTLVNLSVPAAVSPGSSECGITANLNASDNTSTQTGSRQKRVSVSLGVKSKRTLSSSLKSQSAV